MTPMPPTDQPADVPEVDVDTFADALAAGAPVVDVREPYEYVAGHVPGAQLISIGELGARLGEVPTDGTVYVICASGHRSRSAAEALRQQAGIDAVNVAGGTGAWAQSGREIVTGLQAR